MVSSRDTITRIRKLLKKYNPLVFYLVETRANEARLRRFCGKLGKDWKWAAMVANGYSGSIITFWKRHIGCVTPVAISRYALHLVISDNNDADWVFAVIYNDTWIRGQRRLWQELSSLSTLNLA